MLYDILYNIKVNSLMMMNDDVLFLYLRVDEIVSVLRG